MHGFSRRFQPACEKKTSPGALGAKIDHPWGRREPGSTGVALGALGVRLLSLGFSWVHWASMEIPGVHGGSNAHCALFYPPFLFLEVSVILSHVRTPKTPISQNFPIFGHEWTFHSSKNSENPAFEIFQGAYSAAIYSWGLNLIFSRFFVKYIFNKK